MTVIGVLLVAIAAILLIAVLVGGSDHPALLDMGLFDISTSTMGVFLIGAATVLIFVAGLELLRSGLRRSLRRRRELKRARAVVARHDGRDRPAEAAGSGTPGHDPHEAPTAPSSSTSEAPTTATTHGTDPTTGPDPDSRGSNP